MSLLKVEDVYIGYGEITIVRGINFSVDRGEVIFVCGENGSGRTTLLAGIVGISDVKKGRIVFRGKDITGLSVYEIAKMGISYVPEGAEVFPQLTVYENLMVYAHFLKKKDFKDVFSIFPVLKERENQLAGTLSGGERQMLAISRAVVSESLLVILDEPTAGLQPNMAKKVSDVIGRLKDMGKAVIFADKNIEAGKSIADRVIYLSRF